MDIANAYNSLSWTAVRTALVRHEVPAYLAAIVRDYLSGRYIRYPGRGGLVRREMYCDVPHESVLGSILWDMAFDEVLRCTLLARVGVTCYADDTLVTASGREPTRTIRLAELGVATVVKAVERLGLRVSPEKTQVIWFHTAAEDRWRTPQRGRSDRPDPR